MARRIRVYLFGVVLGCIMVYFTLIQGREKKLTGWLPNALILREIKEGNMIIKEKAQCAIDCYSLSATDIQHAITDGDVIISQSEPRMSPKIYLVRSEDANRTIFNYKFSIGNDTTILMEVYNKVKTCDC